MLVVNLCFLISSAFFWVVLSHVAMAIQGRVFRVKCSVSWFHSKQLELRRGVPSPLLFLSWYMPWTRKVSKWMRPESRNCATSVTIKQARRIDEQIFFIALLRAFVESIDPLFSYSLRVFVGSIDPLFSSISHHSVSLVFNEMKNATLCFILPKKVFFCCFSVVGQTNKRRKFINILLDQVMASLPATRVERL